MPYQLDVSTLTSDEAVFEARRRLVISRRRNRLMHWPSYLAASAGMVSSLSHLHAASVWLLALACGVSSVGFLWGAQSGERALSARSDLEDLEALSGNEAACKVVLEVCARSSDAQRVREQALASGRQLYMFDLKKMSIAEWEQERARRKEAGEKEEVDDFWL